MSMTKWLDRGAIRTPFLVLCLDEKAFHVAMKHADAGRPWPEFVGKDNDAVMHSVSNDESATICIVCIHPGTRRNVGEIVCLMAHEAVHVFDAMRADCPLLPFHDDEFEAQIVGHITQVLFEDWMRQTGRARVLPRKRTIKDSQ